MTKILLIRTRREIIDNYIQNPLSPPLGIMLLAGNLSAQTKDQNIKILDLRLYPDYQTVLKQVLTSFNPQIVGFSSLTLEHTNLINCIKLVRQILPEAVTIAGGPHITICHELLISSLEVDFLARGEGEILFYKFCERVREYRLQKSRVQPDQPSRTARALKESLIQQPINGISFTLDLEIYENGYGDGIENVDNLPFPAWNLVDIDAYSRFRHMTIWPRRRRYGAIFTSRGCPYNCIYCHNIFGRNYQAMTPERVLAEINWVSTNFGLDEFEIYDDCFNLDPIRSARILETTARRGGWWFSFPNGLRGDILTPEDLTLYKRAGVYNLTFAIETATDRLQKLIGKNLDLDKTMNNIEASANAGIITNGFFMLGFPTETAAEMLNTLRYSFRSKLHHALYFSVNPTYGSQLYQMIQTRIPPGKIDFNDFSYFHSFFNCSEVSDFKLAALISLGYFWFYSGTRPWRCAAVAPRADTMLKSFWDYTYCNYVNLTDLIRLLK